MRITIFPKRFALLKLFILIFLLLSISIRIIFLIWNFNEIDTSFFNLIETFIIGFIFDIGTVSFFAVPYCLYLLTVPKRWHGSLLDRICTYIGYSLGTIIFLLSFFAEITFWDEFKRRFNFVAVDYLVYTYEVVQNINESYPIALLLGIVLIVLTSLLFITAKKGYFAATFNSKTSLKSKITPSILLILIALLFSYFIPNETAEQFDNRYNNELAKSGIYAFFAAFRNNELPYKEFYKTIDDSEAFQLVKSITNTNETLLFPKDSTLILKHVTKVDPIEKAQHPNVIFICIESLSAKFLNTFGNTLNITPTLDSLSQHGLLFTNLFATGTRTVRGMEAITLSIPPTPGRSIVKRKNNEGLFTIGEIFKDQGYERNFFYGGDGYFDNMNAYFGGNGFNIIDRGRGFLVDSHIKTKRTNIDNNEVTFENAWGVCDEDLYRKVITHADMVYQSGTPFFDFIMTTSNHRPYTYPSGKIDIPSGTGRNGAVKYTDYAIGSFLKQAKTKPWFKNTVFVIMADHCANSAGRWELDVANYHIPAIIFNTAFIKPQTIDKLCSQIDLFPTLFGLFNWDYTSNLFGTNILQMPVQQERAFIGNYRKLGLLKQDELTILKDQGEANFYHWNRTDNSLSPTDNNQNLLKTTIAYYQVADYLYHNDGLKINGAKIHNN